MERGGRRGGDSGEKNRKKTWRRSGDARVPPPPS